MHHGGLYEWSSVGHISRPRVARVADPRASTPLDRSAAPRNMLHTLLLLYFQQPNFHCLRVVEAQTRLVHRRRKLLPWRIDLLLEVSHFRRCQSMRTSPMADRVSRGRTSGLVLRFPSLERSSIILLHGKAEHGVACCLARVKREAAP